MNRSEQDIVKAVVDGDHSAFEYFVEEYSSRVFSLIVGIARTAEEAEELTQDTFLKAFKNLSKFSFKSSFSTWLYRIAYNTAITSTKRKRYSSISIDESRVAEVSDLDADSVLDADIDKLYSAIEQLEPTERVLIELFYLEEWPIKRIEEVVGLSQSNIKVKLHRIRKKLYILMR